jgi:ABC-type antimicrobial peptide transport system permease subunit
MLGQMFVKVRTTGEPAAMMSTLHREIRQLAPSLAPAWSETASSAIANASGAEASLASLVSVAGAIALFLAMVGLYGTMAQAVVRRTREIGVRIALGARTHEVTAMILRDTGRLVLAGLVLGVPAAWASGRVVEGFLFGVSPADLSTTLACCVAVIGVAAVAGLVPARRAARIDPIVILQQD